MPRFFAMEIAINPNLSHCIQVIEAIGKPPPLLLIPNYAAVSFLSRPQSALKVYLPLQMTIKYRC